MDQSIPCKEKNMKRTIFILAVATLIVSACATRAAAPDIYQEVQPAYDERAYGEGAPSEPLVAEESAGGYDPYKTMNSSVPAPERLVIQNVDMSIVVTDPQAKMDAIAALAEEMGGFVVNSNLYQTLTDNDILAPEAYITIRVPAERLDSAINQVEADVIEVRNKNRTGQDVTQEYVDLQSRLTAYEDALDQLEVIMETNTTPEQVLSVFQQMMYYREQIEIIKGQMQYYETAAALSAISVTIVAEETIQPLKIGPWTPKGAAQDAYKALVKFLRGFVEFVIWLFVLVLPILIVIFGPIALIVWGIVVLARRSKAKRVQAASESTAIQKSGK
jgi:hypothetical protein